MCLLSHSGFQVPDAPQGEPGQRFVTGANSSPPQGHPVMVSPMESLCQGPICTPAREEKQPLGQKQIPNPPTLTPYLGWENIVHHIPDVRAQDTLVGQCQPLQLH